MSTWEEKQRKRRNRKVHQKAKERKRRKKIALERQQFFENLKVGDCVQEYIGFTLYRNVPVKKITDELIFTELGGVYDRKTGKDIHLGITLCGIHPLNWL